MAPRAASQRPAVERPLAPQVEPGPSPLVLALLLVLAGLAGLTPPAGAQSDELAFLEAFALADDRAATLDALLPGSDEASFYRALLAQQEGRLDEVDQLLPTWSARHGRTERLREIERRQALLRADDGAYRQLIDELSLRFDHRRQGRSQDVDLPSVLDPALVDEAAFVRRALAGRSDLSNLHQEALRDQLDQAPDGYLLLDLLTRLQRPDHPALVSAVSRALDVPQSRGFGSLAIHRKLTTRQLDDLARLRPALRRNPSWLASRVASMRPHPSVDLEQPGARREWLLTLEAFARELPEVHNSFKAHVLYHLLELERGQGRVERARLIDYLRLPRRTWLRPEPRSVASDAWVQGGVDMGTGLPNLPEDEALIRGCLELLFAAGDGPDLFGEFLREDFVRHVYAETRLLAGLGDPDESAAILDDPAALASLRDRVELILAPGQPTRLAADEPAALEVDLKRVDDLLVKVYAIDTFGHLSSTGQPVDAGLDLAGLVPHTEQRLSLDAPPMRRVRRRVELPGVVGPGTWIVELVGGGLSARAVLRRGQLSMLERAGAAGHVLTVLDDDGQALPGAEVWLDGRRFTADGDGEVLVPFGSSAAERTVVLRHGLLASLARFDHREEEYDLDAGLFVDREALLADGSATLVVRPQLWVAEQPAAIALLEQPRLEIEATDLAGRTTRLDRHDISLSDDAETVLELPVPDDLTRLRITLAGSIPYLSKDGRAELRSEPLELTLNVIDLFDALTQALLSRTTAGYQLELRGKNGEPLAGRPVSLDLSHEATLNSVSVELQTDAVGRIALGPLPGIEHITWQDTDAAFPLWTLPTDNASLPDTVVLAEGETLRLPVSPTTRRVSLLERRGEAYAADHGQLALIEDGLLSVTGLPAGTHDLWLPATQQAVTVEVLAGQRRGALVVGPHRSGQALPPSSLRVTALTADDATLNIQLADAGPDARVHVLAGRYLPTLEPGERLGVGHAWRAPVAAPPAVRNLYGAAEPLSDELRYILERRLGERHPGNLLPRPRLVLNPWEGDRSFSSSGAADVVGAGSGAGGFGGRGKLGRRTARASARAVPTSPHSFATLDFLAAPSRLLTDLRADADGRLVVPREALGDAQLVTVVAVQGEASVRRQLPLAPRSLQRRDRRLPTALVLDDDVTEQRRIDVLAPGETVVFEDVATTRAELYATLDDVFQLFAILGDEAALRPWAFLTGWPGLTREQQLARYDEFACHELHLFLYRKDRDFFEQVVRPYLANKRHKTFVDHWLLDDDLTPYLEPGRYAELNVVERILLGRRLPAVAEAVRRQLADVLALRPDDPRETRRRFELALTGGAARSGDSLGRELAQAGAALMALELPRSVDPEMADQLMSLGYLGEDTFDTGHEAVVSEDMTVDVVGVGGGGGGFRAPGLLTGRSRKAAPAKDLERRASAPRLYTGPGATRAWVEQHYWKLPLDRLDGALIPLDAFWLDLAATPAGAPFVSAHVTAPTGNLHAMLLALALLDLPFEAEPAVRERDGRRLTLSVPGRALLVNQVLAPAPAADEAAPLLLSQDLYRLGERYVFEGNQRRDAFLRGELLAGVSYGCQVVLTNPGSAPRDVELLVQIPAGALPVAAGQASTGRDIHLEPFATTTLDVAFYLPTPGTYALAPARVAVDGALLARAEARTLTVVAEPSTIDTTSWEHVSQEGSLEQVLAFLTDANLARLDLSRIAWRLADRDAFDAIVSLLRGRLNADSVVWSYGLRHRDPATSREFLSAHPLAGQVGRWLDAPLLSVDPEQRRWYEHVDFDPLVNARAHPEGGVRVIRDDAVADHWRELLEILAYKPALDDDDRLAVLYHLLLQDRVDAALAQFARIDPAALEARLQFDYVSAYLAFFGSDPQAAAGLARRHAEHPVARWRERFAAVLTQLDEAARLPGAAGETGGAGEDAAVPPALELALEDGALVLRHEGLSAAELRFTPMDVELLFSMQPFGEQGAGGARSVRPHAVRELALDPSGSTRVELPAAFAQAHVLVEVRAGELSRREVHYAHDLSVQLHEQQGELSVRDPATGRPLPAVYVKVYARDPGGHVRFHKDGYTDLRGRFDYVALSDPDAAGAERFAVLVLDEGRGAVVREAEPPAR